MPLSLTSCSIHLSHLSLRSTILWFLNPSPSPFQDVESGNERRHVWFKQHGIISDIQIPMLTFSFKHSNDLICLSQCVYFSPVSWGTFMSEQSYLYITFPKHSSFQNVFNTEHSAFVIQHCKLPLLPVSITGFEFERCWYCSSPMAVIAIQQFK